MNRWFIQGQVRKVLLVVAVEVLYSMKMVVMEVMMGRWLVRKRLLICLWKWSSILFTSAIEQEYAHRHGFEFSIRWSKYDEVEKELLLKASLGCLRSGVGLERLHDPYYSRHCTSKTNCGC